jgi:hypothetical protein
MNTEKSEISKNPVEGKASAHFIGISMGGTKLYAALYRCTKGERPETVADRTVVWKDAFHLDDPRDVADPGNVSADDIVAKIAETVRSLLAERGLAVADLDNIGCTSPGPLDREKGIIGSACKTFNLPFDKYPFVQKLEDSLAAPHVEIKHDSHSGLEGEIALGALSDVSRGYYIIQGTGLGGSASKDRMYYAAIPELTEPGHHIVGSPIPDEKYRYRFRFIMKKGKDHPYEVVLAPDFGKKSYQITQDIAEEMIAQAGARRENFIWTVNGEKDLEDVVAGVAFEPLLKDKRRLAEQFGGTETDYRNMNEPKDLSELALNGTPADQDIAKRIMRYIAEEMGKAVAALIATSYHTEWQLERVVVGSAIGERLGLGLKAESGEDFYFYHMRESAKQELTAHFGLPNDFSHSISQQIVRSRLTQEVRETAGFCLT